MNPVFNDHDTIGFSFFKGQENADWAANAGDDVRCSKKNSF